MLAQRPSSALKIHHTERGTNQEVLEGALLCRACGFEFPIIDGIPIIVANVRDLVANQLRALTMPADLSPYLMGFIADCAGAASEFDTERYLVGTYGHSHWAEAVDSKVAASGALALSRAALALTDPPRGTWLDLGCSLGRASVELARAGAELVCATDMNLGVLRAFRRALQTGVLNYDLRRVGVVYDRRQITLHVEPEVKQKIAVWACDASVIPFATASVAGVLSLNVIDCVPYPLNHVSEVARVLAPDGNAVFATPFDWSVKATGFDYWVGGHSPRGPHRGGSKEAFERVVGAEDPMQLGLRLQRSTQAAWSVHAHERLTMEYQTYLAAVKRV
jgi:SAM-dependent methyltransferase/uncharacterized protein YbaR (Trm112 family)